MLMFKLQNMSLPSDYQDVESYLQDCMYLLHKYRWIHQHANTDILLNGVIKEVSEDWAVYFNHLDATALNNIALGVVDKNAPSSFKELLALAKRLTPKYLTILPKTTPKNFKMSKKKCCEIYSAAPLIYSNCKLQNIHYVIDIGSGLGYLSQLLHVDFKLNILGIETNKAFVEAAYKRQAELYPSSKNFVKYKHFTVTDDSAKALHSILVEEFPGFDETQEKVCIVALHACADLSLHIVNVFHNVSFASLCISMPCCYHRLKGTDQTFENFPMSAELKNCVLNITSNSFFTRPFLRLACQQSNNSWKIMTKEDHDVHAKNVLFRNILQVVTFAEQVTITRKKRKTGGKKVDYTIEDFLSQLELGYQFSDLNTGLSVDDSRIKEIKSKILEYYLKNYHTTERTFECLSALQALFQGICENLILLDRCAYVNSLGMKCTTEKVTDDCISPRCFAQILTKD